MEGEDSRIIADEGSTCRGAEKGKIVVQLFSDRNQTVEGAMGRSVYKTAIHKGLNKQRSASIANNTSVNFNQKGQSG